MSGADGQDRGLSIKQGTVQPTNAQRMTERTSYALNLLVMCHTEVKGGLSKNQ